MALINCPECGQQISDRAPACIHCGFPLEQLVTDQPETSPAESHAVVVHSYDPDRIYGAVSCLARFTDADEQLIKKYLSQAPFVFLTGGENPECNATVQLMARSGVNASVIADSDITDMIVFPQDQVTFLSTKHHGAPTTTPSTVTCPRCGSTQITTGQRGYKLLTGFLGSSKTVNRCANCGYKWEPSYWTRNR